MAQVLEFGKTTKLRPFTEYEGTVKTRDGRVPLGPLTAIVGDESTYKSALGIGMRLALTGQYDQVGKLPSDLICLAADPTLGIRTTLYGPDGDAEWELKVDEDGKVKKSAAPIYSGKLNALTLAERSSVIPTDSIRDLLKNAKGEKKLREAILRKFSNGLTHIPEPDAFDEETLAVWYECVTLVNEKHHTSQLSSESPTPETVLSGLSEYARLESGRLSREKKPIETYIAARRKSLRESEMLAGVSPELLPKLEKQLALAKTGDQVAEKTEALRKVQEQIGELADELPVVKSDEEKNLDYQAKADLIKLEIEALKLQGDSLNEELKEKIEKATVAEFLTKQYEALLAKNKSHCPFCSNETDIEAALKKFKAKAIQRANERDQLENHLFSLREAAAEKRDQLSAVESCISKNSKSARAQIEYAMTCLREEESVLKRQIEELSPKIHAVVDIEDIQRKITVIKTNLETKTELMREAKKLKDLEVRHAALKLVEREATYLQKILMEKIAEHASDEVSKGMLDGRRAILNPDTCEWSVVARPDADPHPFSVCSGTERTSLMLGLAAAWTRGSPFRFALFDDEDLVGLSEKGIKDFYRQCERLYETGDFNQVIVINNRPELAPPSGWTVIHRRNLEGR